jgi:hypothetical protein
MLGVYISNRLDGRSDRIWQDIAGRVAKVYSPEGVPFGIMFFLDGQIAKPKKIELLNASKLYFVSDNKGALRWLARNINSLQKALNSDTNPVNTDD